ncbi:MAG: stage II sporulation protein R, partial [Clostridia bacterium]|nr:stage II sporulation protein R [Clostridia bacterium]
EAVLAANLPAIESAARHVLAERGSAHSVRATLGEAYYPTRVYDGVTLPAGTYKSLSVAIGGGEGANWWCVLFPQLCTGGEAEEAMVAAGLTPSQIRLITGDSPDVVIRFRLLEWLTAIFSGR